MRPIERNLRLYPLYVGVRGLLFWPPVFFVYFSSRLTVDQVLVLEAVYYAVNVLFEVPSGYFSDRVGRKPTLLVAALASVLGYSLLATATEFNQFALGQCLMALGFAFVSGTDTALLYDSLKAVGREQEMLARESKAWTFGFGANALGALIGGLSATVDLRAGHALTALSALAVFVVACFYVEPERHEARQSSAATFGAISRALRNPVLAWLFVLAVAARIFGHVPYMFFQPYVEHLFGAATEFPRTPVILGCIVGATTLISAGASSLAPRLSARLGPFSVLLVSFALYGLICTLMATVLHPLVLLAIVVRSTPRALSRPVIASLIHPRLANSMRATYFSVQTLMGSLGFAAVLLLTSRGLVGHDDLSRGELSTIVGRLAVAIVATLLLLSATLGWVRRREVVVGDVSG